MLTGMPSRLGCLPLALAVLLTACAGDGGEGPRSQALSGQALAAPVWEDCWRADEPVDYACGRLEVPMRYDDPASGTTTVAFVVRRSPAPIGWLFVNPGGPGISATEMVFASSAHFEPELLERFHVVGVDPRGVGESAPRFGCGDHDAFMELFRRVARDADPEAAEAAMKMCVEGSGPGISFLHAEYAARDIDSVRQALDIDEIGFYGSSYGAVIGAWYATLFGAHVRSMVLDSAPDPNYSATSSDERVERRLEALAVLEQRMADALESCVEPGCPFDHEGDPQGWFRANADHLAVVAEHFDGHGAAPAMAAVTPLYAEELWPLWHEGLRALVDDDDPQLLVAFASLLLDDEAGESSVWNLTAHINCLDDWAGHPELSTQDRIADAEALRDAALARFPLLASVPDLGWSYDLCAFYPPGIAPPPATAARLDGAGAPVLVIGNSADPITPMHETASLAEALDEAWLIEVDHPQHGTYPGSWCVSQHVHAFLIAKQAPAERHYVCEAG